MPDEPPAGVSADALRYYRLSLAIAARRYQRYPAQARAQGWAGSVEVALLLSANGRTSTALSQSSGHGALDEQALSMIGQAAQAIPLPEALQGRSYRLLVPVLFSLEGE